MSKRKKNICLNFSAYGQVEIINVKTAGEASSLLSHLSYYRTNNMNGYELKMGFFSKNELSKEDKIGLSTRYNYNHAFKDIDLIILNTIAEHMNFTYRRMQPTDNKSFGYQLSNGTYVGAIGTNVMISQWNYSRLVYSSCFLLRFSFDCHMIIASLHRRHSVR